MKAYSSPQNIDDSDVRRGSRFAAHVARESDCEALCDSIHSIDVSAFGGESLSRDNILDALRDTRALWVTLHDLFPERIIGYTFAVPSHEKQYRAYIPRVAIAPDFQRRGLVGVLNTTMEEELRARGFRQMELDAEITNGFAPTLMLHYSDRGMLSTCAPLGADIKNHKKRMQIIINLMNTESKT